MKLFVWINFILVICVSGVPFFQNQDEYLLIGLVLSSVLFFAQNNKIDNAFFVVVSLVILLQVFQTVYLKNLPYLTYIGTHVKLFWAYFTIKLLKANIFKYYYRLIYYMTLISFVFYLLALLPGAYEYFVRLSNEYFNYFLFDQTNEKIDYPHIIIFNFHGINMDFPRNSGPFWEPGAYAGFLVIAIILGLFQYDKLFFRKNNLLWIALITTFSTTAYISIFVIFIWYVFSFKKSITGYTFGILLIPISIILFSTLPFLQEKIVDQSYGLDIRKSNTFKSVNTSRFGTAIRDYNIFLNSPIIGNGRNKETRFMGYNDFYSTHVNNGIFSFLASYGLLGFCFYIFGMYYSLKRYLNYNKNRVKLIILFLVGFLLINFSEPLFLKQFFLCLVIYPTAIYKNKDQIELSDKLSSKNFLNESKS